MTTLGCFPSHVTRLDKQLDDTEDIYKKGIYIFSLSISITAPLGVCKHSYKCFLFKYGAKL